MTRSPQSATMLFSIWQVCSHKRRCLDDDAYPNQAELAVAAGLILGKL